MASNRDAFLAVHMDRLVLWLFLAAVIVTVLAGLGLLRDQHRHAEILARRAELLAALKVDEEFELDKAFHYGRPIYLALFGVGFCGAMAVLVRLLSPQ